MDRVCVEDGDFRNVKLDRLLGQEFHVGAACRKPDHVETVEMAGDDVKSLGADGSGGSQNDYG